MTYEPFKIKVVVQKVKVFFLGCEQKTLCTRRQQQQQQKMIKIFNWDLKFFSVFCVAFNFRPLVYGTEEKNNFIFVAQNVCARVSLCEKSE